MGGIRQQNSPTSVGRRSPTQRVGFAEEVVTGYSRPVRNDEHWTLYYFEEHAAHCPQCHDPYKVAKSGKRLCDKGHNLAINVARLVYYSRSQEAIFSRTEQEVRVEIPAKYVETRGLLEAVQRTLRHGEQWLKPRSYDKTYLVPPRHQAHDDHAANDSDESRSSRRSGGSSSSEYDVKVVEPKPSKHRPRRDSLLDQPKRGSLYAQDMDDLQRQLKREQRLKYDVEYREPSSRSSKRHSMYRG